MARSTGRPAVARDQVHRDRVEHGGRHLAGDRTLPDQRIEPALVLVVQVVLRLLRRLRGGGRADRLVRLLRVLRLGLVFVDAVGQRFFAEAGADRVADLGDRVLRQRHRIGAHVGDVARFVQALRGLHRAPRCESELARRFLLQRRGGEWRRRIAALRLALDAVHRQHAARGRDDRALGLARLRLAGDRETAPLRVGFDLLAAVLDEPRGKLRLVLGRIGLDGPVFQALEAGDLGLALADQAQRNALHAAGRESRLDFLPQQRRQVEANQVIERTARLLRVDEVVVEALCVRNRLAHGVLRDLVEAHALHVLVFQHAALAQDLGQVPGDRLALAVGVGREIERIGLAHRAFDGIDLGAVLLDELVLHLEVVVGVDRAFLFDEVADVAIRSQHLEIRSEVLLDGLRLGRRFHDD